MVARRGAGDPKPGVRPRRPSNCSPKPLSERFQVVFLFEILVRILAERCRFWCDPWNVLDLRLGRGYHKIPLKLHAVYSGP